MEFDAIINLFKAIMTGAIHDLEGSIKDFEKGGRIEKLKRKLDLIDRGKVLKTNQGKIIKRETIEKQILNIKREYIENNNFFYSDWCKDLCNYIDLDYDFLVETLRKRNVLKEKDYEPVL